MTSVRPRSSLAVAASTALVVLLAGAPGAALSDQDAPASSATVDVSDRSDEMTSFAVSPPADRTPALAGGDDRVTGTADIRGTVTELGSGAPVAGAWVAVLQTTDFSAVGYAIADNSGNYGLDLPDGEYHLYLLDPTGRHAAGFHGAPAAIEVRGDAVVDVDPVMAPTRGSITGTVTDALGPVAGAWILSLNGTTGALETAVAANADGRYALGDLRSGSHFVAFVNPSGGHGVRFHPSATTLPESTPVDVVPGATTTADGVLPAQPVTPSTATVAGTVSDERSGTALQGVVVIALRAADFGFARAAVTDGSGRYSLRIAPGQYILATVDATGTHDMEWSGGVPADRLGSAALISAPGVADAALLESTGSMQGTVKRATTSAPVGGVGVVAVGPGGVEHGVTTAPDGSYRITGLPPGEYRAQFLDAAGDHLTESWTGPDGSPTFRVGAGHAAVVDADLTPVGGECSAAGLLWGAPPRPAAPTFDVEIVPDAAGRPGRGFFNVHIIGSPVAQCPRTSYVYETCVWFPGVVPNCRAGLRRSLVQCGPFAFRAYIRYRTVSPNVGATGPASTVSREPPPRC